jgi:hypothetical protein
MQSVGAAWLMVSLNAGPMNVALTQTESALPFFILALPAGASWGHLNRHLSSLKPSESFLRQ